MDVIWQPGYFDRYMRNEEHFWRTVRYILKNPVASKLCDTPDEFPWSSAYEHPPCL